MTDAATTSDRAWDDWERFRQRLTQAGYRVYLDMTIQQVMRYAYDAGWADGHIYGRRALVGQSKPVYQRNGPDNLHRHDGKEHEHDGGDQLHVHYPGIPPGWEPAYLEG